MNRCLLVNFKDLVPMLLCLILTLFTSNLFTCPLVNSSTQRYVTLSFTYPVYKQLVHSSTKHVNSFTYNLVNFFQVRREWKVVFWLLKDALLDCKRCPLRPLLTPFWSLNKHLLLSCFIIIWFSASCKLTHNTCFSPLFQGFYWRVCQGFWHG